MQLPVLINSFKKKLQNHQNDSYFSKKKQSSKQNILTSIDTNHISSKLINNNKSLRDQNHGYFQKELTYIQICRKYDKLKQIYDDLQIQFDKQKKIKLQQSMDVQNKFHLLLIQNQKNIAKIDSKQNTIANLQQKLSQKEEQALIFEEQIQLISKKLSQVMRSREQQSLKIPSQQISSPSTQQSSQSIHHLKQHYQNYIIILTTEISNQNTKIFEKQKQNHQIFQSMQQKCLQYQIKIQQLNQIINKNQKQYHNWVNQIKQQKIKIIQFYQNQLKKYKKSQLSNHFNDISKNIKNQFIMEQLNTKNQQLGILFTNVKLQKDNIQITLNNLNQQLNEIKNQYIQQTNQNLKLSINLKNEQNKSNFIQKQLQQLKKKYDETLTNSKKLQKQLQNTNQKLSSNQINNLTQTTQNQKSKIQSLQQQLYTTTTQLYAQRLQKAKILQQIQQTKLQLKTHYQFQLQTKNQQFITQIKQNSKTIGTIDVQKQKIYLDMLKLQRQYQLLKTQLVTSDQVLRMGNKMSKYYQKRVK